MPGVLGWTAARGRLEWGALVMFASSSSGSSSLLFHRMALSRGLRRWWNSHAAGSGTGRQVHGQADPAYSLALIPMSLLPAFLGMSGNCTWPGPGAGIALLYFGWRLASLKVASNTARSKQRARQLLQATVLYLPLLFALMMLNTKS